MTAQSKTENDMDADALGVLAEALGLQLVALGRTDGKANRAHIGPSWIAGTSSAPPLGYLADELPWICDAAPHKTRPWSVSLTDMPLAARRDKATLERLGIKSLHILPVAGLTDGWRFLLLGSRTADSALPAAFTGLMPTSAEVPAPPRTPNIPTPAAGSQLSSAILASIKDHVAVVDREGRIVAVNDAWKKFAHDSQAAPHGRVSIGVNYLEVCRCAADNDDTDARTALAGIEAVLRGENEDFSMDYQCSSPSRQRWFRMTVVPLQGPGGGAVISHQEISAYRHARNRLLASLRQIRSLKQGLQKRLRFENLISELSARLAGVTADRIDAEIDEALARILSFFEVDQCGIFKIDHERKRARLLYFHHIEGVVPASIANEYPKWFPWGYDKLVRRGEIVALNSVDDIPAEAVLDRKSYTMLSMRSSLNIPVQAGGTTRYVFSLTCNTRQFVWPQIYPMRLRLLGEIFASVLSRAESERALRRSERDLLEAQRIAQTGNWEMDLADRTLHWSPAMSAIVGAVSEASSADGRGLLRFVDPPDQLALLGLLTEVAKERANHIDLEFGILGASTIKKRLYVRGEVSRDAEGKALRIFGTAQDVTERSRTEEEMRRLRLQLWHADRVARIGTLTASLTHELNQPLTAILSNAQAGLRFLDREAPDLDEIRSLLDDIVRDDKRASSVIRSLRAMMRRQETPREEIDIGKALHEVLVMVHGKMAGENIVVSERIADGCRITADKTQIQHVALNLLMNAAEAMDTVPAGAKHLRLSVEPAGGEIAVCLCDSGPGIDPSELDRIFEPFWTTKAEGLGMGLVVCRSIIEAHGGTIRMHNNAPDPGTSVVLRLPKALPTRAPSDLSSIRQGTDQ